MTRASTCTPRMAAPPGIADFEANGADVVLTDLAMPDVDGMKVLATLRAQDPSVPVMMLTAHGSERVAVAAMKAGAFDYIPKPFDPDELALAVKRGVETRVLRLENARLRTQASLGRPIVAESPALRRVLDVVARVAPKDVTVLLTGESGVGKDVLAATLHAHSKRADKPFIRFNAAAIPAELAEAELFGHMKGAFTGAHAARARLLPAGRQGHALHRRDRRAAAGDAGEDPARHPVRRGAARRRPRRERRRPPRRRDQSRSRCRGQGRPIPEDLFYRLNVVPIRVPPLRERARTSSRSCTRSCARTPNRYGMGQVEIEPALVDAFKTDPWPGNVRELENTVARLLALTADDRLTLALWRSLDAGAPASARLSLSSDPGPSHPLRARVEGFERSIIAAEFEAARKNQSETARRLGVSRPALIEKLHKYALLDRG